MFATLMVPQPAVRLQCTGVPVHVSRLLSPGLNLVTSYPRRHSPHVS
jgi:hypothetical protein